jgi:hypothetical protein
MRCDECKHFIPIGSMTGCCEHIVSELWLNHAVVTRSGRLGVHRSWFCGFYKGTADTKEGVALQPTTEQSTPCCSKCGKSDRITWLWSCARCEVDEA